jgi:hypothetical protein
MERHCRLSRSTPAAHGIETWGAAATIKSAKPGAVARLSDSCGPVFRRRGDGERLERARWISEHDRIDERLTRRAGVLFPTTLADGARPFRRDRSPWGLAEW